MKRILKLILVVTVIAAFSMSASAAEADKYIEQLEDILPENAVWVTDTEKLVSSVGAGALLEELGAVLSGRRGEIFAFFLLLLGVCTLSSAAAFVPEGIREVTECGVGLICSALIIERVLVIFSETLSSLSSLGEFFGAAAPIMASISLAGGGTGTAAVELAGITLAVSYVGGVLCSALSVAVGFLMAMGMLSAFGDPSVTSLAMGARNTFMWLVSIATVVIMGTFSLQSVVATAADSAAMRSVKYVASGMIPIVGSTVSGAMATLASGLSYAKSVVGAGAVAVIVGGALAPLVVLLLYRLSFTVASRLCEAFSPTRQAAVLRGFAGALDALIAVYSLSMLLYIFELILLMKSGVALLG